MEFKLPKAGFDCIPTVSKLWEFGETSIVDTVPWDGLNPIIPQNEAGTLMPPTVSVPTITLDMIKMQNGAENLRMQYLFSAEYSYTENGDNVLSRNQKQQEVAPKNIGIKKNEKVKGNKKISETIGTNHCKELNFAPLYASMV